MPKPRCKTSKEVLAHVDGSKPVKVYRNLHKKCLSVQQSGRVVCHTDNIVLRDCTFMVNENGRQKVLATKHKNVHAYVKGTVVDARATDGLLPIWEQVRYNPYQCDSFRSVKGGKLEGAEFVDLEEDMLAFNLTFKKDSV